MHTQVHTNLTPALQKQIHAFLATQPAGACGEHDPRWLHVLRQAMGHQPIILITRRSHSEHSDITGYLPLVLVRSRLFGRFLVSLPYLNRAGIVASNDDAASALLQYAAREATAHEVQYMELRHHAVRRQHEVLTHENHDKQRMLLDLPGQGDQLWAQYNAKVRNQIRKGDKCNLTIHFGSILDSNLLDAFYHVFAVNMRDLGTPVYSKLLFRAICHHFADDAELAVVYAGEQPVAGALLWHDQACATRLTQVPSASCLRAFNHTNANMWMYHQLLQRAVARGSTQFDFGRSSPESGTYRFKKQWGARAVPTPWQYHLRYGSLGDMRPDHPRYRRRIETWQKLPVWVTKMIGPAIVRGIP